jgi:hypothetical protein
MWLLGLMALTLLLAVGGGGACLPRSLPRSQTYRYLCTLVGPGDLVNAWKSRFGDAQTVITFDATEGVVHFLGAVAAYSGRHPGSSTWTYRDLFTHRDMTAVYDGDTQQMFLEGGDWHCQYQGPSQ